MIGVTLILINSLTSLVAANFCQTVYPGSRLTINNILVSCALTDNGNTALEIECLDSSKSLSKNFTNVQLGVNEIDQFSILSCAFPAEGFRLIDSIDSLGEVKIDTLKIANPKSAIKREHLNGLSLRTLKFDRLNVTNLPGDLLQGVEVRENLIFMRSDVTGIPEGLIEHVVNIKRLDFFGNKEVNLHRNDLDSLTQLKALIISANRHVNIEDGAFDRLQNLEIVGFSSNNLKTLPAEIFLKLENLQDLSISANKLVELPIDLLRIKNSKLQSFRMNNIRGGLQSLPAGFFKDLRNLEQVELKGNGLTRLPADLFSGAISLKKVELASNKIVELPVGIFNDAIKLTELNLANNKLTSLPENIFSKNQLQKLNLDYNKLTNLTEGNLDGLHKLKSFSIAHNALSNVQIYLYKKLISLEEINISHNHLTLQFSNDSDYSIFLNCQNLRKLDASYNKVSEIFVDFQYLLIRELNLAGNKITEISDWHLNMLIGYLNLSSNKITSMNFGQLKVLSNYYAEINHGKKRGTVVDLDDNPLHCDCAILDLVRYLENQLNESVYDFVTLNARRLKCASPPELANRRVIHLSSSELYCPVKDASKADACNGTCSCLDYPAKNLLVIDCSNKNLTSVPEKITNPNNRPIELNMSGNKLGKTPVMNQGYLQKVISLDLSSNNISNINDDVLLGSVQKLKLDNNNISTLNSEIVKSLKEILL